MSLLPSVDKRNNRKWPSLRHVFSVAFTSVALMVCEVEAKDEEEAIDLAQEIAEETRGRKLSLLRQVKGCRDTYMQMDLTARAPDISEIAPVRRMGLLK